MTILRIFGFYRTLYRRAVNQLIKYIERGPNYKSDEGEMKTAFAEQYINSIDNSRLLGISSLINKQ